MIAKELVEEKRHLHHRIGEGLTRPQVFRRAASLCHNAIESPPADGQGEQRRSEQPAPLSLTRSMRMHQERHPTKRERYHYRLFCHPGFLLPLIEHGDIPLVLLLLDRLAT